MAPDMTTRVRTRKRTWTVQRFDDGWRDVETCSSFSAAMPTYNAQPVHARRLLRDGRPLERHIHPTLFDEEES